MAVDIKFFFFFVGIRSLRELVLGDLADGRAIESRHLGVSRGLRRVRKVWNSV